jgi:integrase/recombinase XerD
VLAATPKRLPQVLTRDEVRALFTALPRRGRVAARNRAILALMYRAGLRVSEVCRLRLSDLDGPSLSVHVRRGKGGRDRVVYPDLEAWRILARWLAAHPGGEWAFPLLRATPWRRELDGDRHVTPRYIEALVRKLARKAGIAKRVTPHTLRHTYATEAVREGIPLHQVQRDLGHAHLATTAVYLHVADTEREARARTRAPAGIA